MTEAAAQAPAEEPRIEPLPHLDEDWERALVVVAHPDDIEYAAAAAARWTGQGKHISYCMITSGEAGIDALEPEVSRPIREQEQRAAAAVVGCHRRRVPRLSGRRTGVRHSAPS